LVFPGNGNPSGSEVLLPRVLFFLISSCFWRIGRELVSGQNAENDHLLPRGMMKTIEPMLGVAAIAWSVSRQMVGLGGVWPGPICWHRGIALSEETPETRKALAANRLTVMRTPLSRKQKSTRR
jgi:hypothetical protein